MIYASYYLIEFHYIRDFLWGKKKTFEIQTIFTQDPQPKAYHPNPQEQS